MANINKNELTKEQIEKAMACETAEELMVAAKAEGIDLTRDEAEAYIQATRGRNVDEIEIPSSDVEIEWETAQGCK